jgi:peptidoglycan/LPS O-acetylase OafA/YrhL
MKADRTARRPEIDGLRAVAVLAVVLAHGVDPGLGPFWCDVGSRGVDLFFVLSGFCLSYPYLAHADAKPLPTIGEFLRHRFARIAPPYYVALVLFGALAFTQFGLPTWPERVPGALARLRELGLDAVFLTNAMPMHNADFWTLGVEMRWYVLLPLVLALYVRSRVLFAILGLALYADYASPFGIADAGTMPCFMLGIVAADFALRRPAWSAHVWPLALLALAFALWQQSTTNDVDQGNWVWHVAAFALVASVVGNAALRRAFSAPALVAVGVASYSIYLVHHPLVQSFVQAGVPVPLAFGLALACGFAFWRLIEVPCLRANVRGAIEDALRFDWLRRALAKREATPALPPSGDSPVVRS